MLLSVVSGTMNRIDYLKRMIESVRSQMPKHLTFEFVIVDAGSTDGTLEYLEAQPDVKLIAHGNLRGAIKSFGEGARAASGDYILMSNDDVQMHENSILRAISHLEEHRTCGIVAMADNRYSLATQETPQQYRVMKMPAIDLDGNMVSVNYGQICMIRSWLGNLVGWWGDQDPIMGKARTYAGDNFQSAMVWQLGYSVDSVAGCAVDDFIPPDEMRTKNVSTGSRDSAQYYARFPRGPRLQPYPQVHNPDRERLRVIVMDIHEPAIPARTAKERGLAEAFAEIGLVVHYDYVNDTERDLVSLTRAWQPHLIITQAHDTTTVSAELLRQVRAEKPDTVIVNWVGDAHLRCLTTPDIMEMLGEVDLQTVVNAAVLPTYERAGIPAAYWQIGWKQAASAYEREVPAHEVLIQMNCYDDRRKALVAAVRAIRVNKRKLNVGVYGSCAGANGNTHYSFSHQEALNRAATLVIGDTYPDTEAFVSNRVFQVLGAGGFLLQQESTNLQEYTGLTDGVHLVHWSDLADLKAKIGYWLRPERAAQRAAISEAGQAFVQANYSYPRQVEKLIHDLL